MKPGRRHISPSAGAGPRVRCLELGLCLPSISSNSFASSPQSSQSQQDHSQGRGFLTGRCSVFDFSGMHWHKPRGDSGFINTHRAPIHHCLGSCLQLVICWTGLWEAAGADTALDPALLPALWGTEALFRISTQSNKTGVGQSESKQEALGKLPRAAVPGAGTLRAPQAQGKIEMRTAAAQEEGLEGPW